MADWGIAFDEQCRSEGLEVPEKVVGFVNVYVCS